MEFQASFMQSSICKNIMIKQTSFLEQIFLQ